MYTISFDVGIKNLAISILETKDNTFDIVYWDVISMINYSSNKSSPQDISKPLCQKDNCKTIARYTNKSNDNMLCLKHTKERFIILPKGTTMKSIQNMDKDSLLLWLIQNKINLDSSKMTSKTAIYREIRDKLYIPISKSTKSIKCDQFSLIHCSYELKTLLDDIHDRYSLPNNVLIENQISPKAARMKSIQSMITMYYTMKGIHTTNIHYISSLRKLTILPKSNDSKISTTYDQRKECSVKYTHLIIDTDYPKWIDIFSKHKKKDDLADCLLQGIWWLSNENIIVLKEYKI